MVAVAGAFHGLVRRHAKILEHGRIGMPCVMEPGADAALAQAGRDCPGDRAGAESWQDVSLRFFACQQLLIQPGPQADLASPSVFFRSAEANRASVFSS